MSYKIKKGCMQLADILELAKTDYEDAEFEYNKFEKEYTQDEIIEICEKMDVNLKGVFHEED